MEPRWEKLARPRRADGGISSGIVEGGEVERVLEEAAATAGGVVGHGVASSWFSMTSSILASPQGASEQYMCIETSSRMVKG